MRIIVPIKQVPETNAVKMDEVTGTMIREGVEAIINPLDLYAIEAAILLREQYGGEIVALSMGPAKAVVQVATLQVAVNDLLKVGPPEPVRPFEPLLVDLNQSFKMVLHAPVIIRR